MAVVPVGPHGYAVGRAASYRDRQVECFLRGEEVVGMDDERIPGSQFLQCVEPSAVAVTQRLDAEPLQQR